MSQYIHTLSQRDANCFAAEDDIGAVQVGSGVYKSSTSNPPVFSGVLISISEYVDLTREWH